MPHQKTAGNSGSLPPPQLEECLLLLKCTKSPEVAIRSTIDATRLFESIRSKFKPLSSELGRGQISNLQLKFGQWIRRAGKSKGQAAFFSDGSVRVAVDLILSLLRAHENARESEPMLNAAKNRKKGSLSRFSSRCFDLVWQLCELTERSSSWRHALTFLASAKEILGTSRYESILNRSVKDRLNSLFERTESDVLALLKEGNVVELAWLYGSTQGHPQLRQDIVDAVKRLSKEKGASLPFASQEWILQTLGVSRESSAVQFANPAEDPEVRQAASLLLFLFDSSTENQIFREAFERFQTICARHFKLLLKGDVGQTVKYDPVYHDVRGTPTGTARLRRPWVEWSNPPRSIVVIRALAEPLESVSR